MTGVQTCALPICNYEPALAAATRSLGDSVEIRIRDNGTGIPPEVKEKMFNPFFTTKPAGEGTGLGLSMSHDIVVKQHDGQIEVATQTGVYTEMTITLPRSSSPSEVFTPQIFPFSRIMSRIVTPVKRDAPFSSAFLAYHWSKRERIIV